MIQIKVDASEIPQDWLKRAEALTRSLRGCADDDDSVAEEERKSAKDKRRQLIRGHSGLWTELKDLLLKWSHGKCWYSELRDDGSDYHIDHFRPKNRVRNEGEPERDGYWWLAFDWRNFRVSVAWVNSLHGAEDGPARGKADNFPLAPGSPVVTTPEGDLKTEQRVLLDPIDPYDVLLIDFDETGLPVPAVEGWHAERVMRTRRLLHLDAMRMNEARQSIWRECEELVLLAATALEVPVGEHRPRDAEAAARALALLCVKLRPDAPLSAVAHAYMLKCPRLWARRLMLHPLSQMPGTAGAPEPTTQEISAALEGIV